MVKLFWNKGEEGFKPNCEIDTETLEVACKPEWDRGEKLEAADGIKFRVLGKKKLQIISTGDASEEIFNKTYQFVLNKTMELK